MAFKVRDHYYKKAKQGRFLARSVFKLEEMDKRFGLLRPGMRVLDCGYHPGSWAQYASRVVGARGGILGIDRKPVDGKLSHLKNFRPVQGDILDFQDLAREGVFDAILSDMAPNTTGIKSLDQDRALNLVEKVFLLIKDSLRPGGSLLIKVFDSHKAREFLKRQRDLFGSVAYCRPQATRTVSKEFFVVAQNYAPQ